MSLKGGYKIIDLKGIDVTQNTMMIEGIYESIENNYGKPLLISGIVIDGVEKNDVFVQATLNGTAYEFDIYGYTIQIQDTDAVGIKSATQFNAVSLTQDTTITLKNGDLYFIYGVEETAFNIDLLLENCYGVSIGFASDLTEFFKTMSYNRNVFSCQLNGAGGGNYMVAVINNIIYITLNYEF